MLSWSCRRCWSLLLAFARGEEGGMSPLQRHQKPAKGPCLPHPSPLTPHPLPYHNAINKSPGAGTQRSQSSSQSQTVVLSWEFIQYREVRSHMKSGAVYVKVLVIIHTTYHVPASLPKFLVFVMIPKGSSSLHLSLPLPLFFFLPSICSFFNFFYYICVCMCPRTLAEVKGKVV